MKKTKIVCTMGPNTNDREMMRKLIQNGMNVARFNFSHGDHEEQKFRMDMLKELREEEHANTAILLDTKGPEIRTGILKDGKKITLKEGETFTLTTEDIIGDNKRVSITYKGLVQDIYKGCSILIDDGLIGLRVESKTETEIVCSVVNGGELGERKGVNVPNVAIRLPAITEKDKDDIRFGVEQGIDFIAASFVRNAECVLEIKAYLKELGAPYVPIIAKVENAEGIKNIDEIIRAADGVMVARGDLGVEIPAEEVQEVLAGVKSCLPEEAIELVDAKVKEAQTADKKISNSDWIAIIGIIVTILLFIVDQCSSVEHEQKEEAAWSAFAEYQQESIELQKQDLTLKQEILDCLKNRNEAAAETQDASVNALEVAQEDFEGAVDVADLPDNSQEQETLDKAGDAEN